jgi:glycosyltransferase involved in cell wall biosynthesis
MPDDGAFPRLHRAEPAGPAPALAIVIPVFRHAALLVEAVESVLAQRCPFPFAVVIVDDGCPLQQTRDVASAYALADRRVTYLRKPNGGLSSARNFGIDVALRRWPTLRAVYLLDADNRLTPTAMADAMAFMERERADWVYPNIDKFGVEESANYAGEYSRLMHVAWDNLCEAGSLVSRRVLDAGIRFDESMRAGYEDWEFWLQCIGAGFTGRAFPFFGLEYRQRAESMVRDSHRVRASILDYIRKKHKRLFEPATLLAFEQEEAPRFALFADPSGEVALFTDPDRPHRRAPLAAFAQAFAAEEMEPESIGTPPCLLWLPEPVLGALRAVRLLHGVLWHLQALVERHHVVALRLEPDAERLGLAVEEAPPAPDTATGWAMRQGMLRDCVRDPEDDWLASIHGAQPGPKIATLVVRGPFPALAPIGDAPSPVPTRRALRAARPAQPRRWMWRDSDFRPHRRDLPARAAAGLGASHLLPRIRGRDGRLEVGFALPIGAFGGVERVAYALAGVLRRAGCRTRLFLLGKPEARLTGGLLEAFDGVEFLADPSFPLWGGPKRFMGHDLAMAGDLGEAERALLGMLHSLDVLVAAHAAPLNALLGEIRRSGTKVINHLHVLDRTPAGRDVGHPYLALAFEHASDLLLTCSQRLADWLGGMGVPEAKLLVLPNATGSELPDSVVAPALAARRARRPGPLRALFMGRLDTQKGVERLHGAVRRSRLAGLPVEWRIVGGGVMQGGDDRWARAFAALGVAVEPPVYGDAALAERLAAADVLVLPSRWEGAPLSIIEAQRMGCVPLATRVGAVAELVADGEDGLLVPDGPDGGVAEAIVARLATLAADPARLARLAGAAARRGAAAEWEAQVGPVLRQLAAWFPKARLAPAAEARQAA